MITPGLRLAIQDRGINIKGRVFLVDQPGLGGHRINRASYIKDYGVGHYEFTFLVALNGFNEDEIGLATHFHLFERDFAFVRSKLDADINGIIARKRITYAEANNEVRSKTENEINDHSEDMKEIKKFFIGVPQENFEDYDQIYDLIISNICENFNKSS